MSVKPLPEAEESRAESFSQAERQTLITRQVIDNGSVLVDELVERFNVSRMTIHRDLDDLERQGVLRKVRNGATAQPSSQFESNVRFRLGRQTREKEAMARAALGFIETGQSLILDEATTLLPLVGLLPELAPLTVITNFLPIIEQLKTMPGIHLIGLGGEYMPRFDTFSGALAEQTLATLHADLYITSTTAVANCVTFHPDAQVVSVKRAMMRRASRRILLVDHTKFGKTALHEFAPLTAFEAVIVDASIPAQYLENMQANAVKVYVTSAG